MINISRGSLYRRRAGRQRFVASFLSIGIIGLIVVFLLTFIIIAIFSRDLPSPGKLRRQDGFSTTFLDRNDKVIFELYKDQNRVPVKLAQITDNIKKATIAIEDKDFYHHQGFSITGFARGFISTVFFGRKAGGSTLTQQLVKNVLLTSERSYTRKIREFILAVEIERRYTKDEILEMYLNEAPYGGTLWGIQAASKGYFNKDAKDLNLAESAFLAGLPQRPSVYSPFVGKSDAYIDRTKAVLRRMREDNYITRDQEKKANEDIRLINFTKPNESITAPHFVFYVRDLVSKMFGEETLEKGLRIKTTLDLEMQEKAEEIVKEEIEKIKKLNATNGAVVALDSQTNEILAMVGSHDYNDPKNGQFNAALGNRQPGSAIKPVTYAVAFEKGYTPSTVIMDVKTTFPNQGDKDYEPVNYDGQYRGPVQLRFALGNSLNIPAVKLLAMVGMRSFLQKASEMGLTQFAPTTENINRFGLAITLGGGETRLIDLTSAFSVFARGGIKKDYNSILEVKDYKGKTIYKMKTPPEKRVLSEGASFLISHILSDNNARSAVFGPRSYLNISGKTVAVKTGTTNSKRDNWTIGYTKGITIGVWVGNNDNSPMNEKIASGVTGASPIWNRVMTAFLKSYPDGIPSIPSNVSALQVDSYMGGLPKDGYPVRSEYFINGTEPKTQSSFYKRLKISKSTGKIANDLEVKQGNYDEKDYIVINEDDPISKDGKNRWQEAINAWAQSQSDDKLKPPIETSNANSEDIVIQIKEPGDHARIDSDQVHLRTRVTSLDAVSKIEISVNGTIQKTYTEDKRETDDTLTLSTGVYEIKVRAENTKGKSSEATIKVGVNKNWDEL